MRGGGKKVGARVNTEDAGKIEYGFEIRDLKTERGRPKF
jgi:hypothetical protein